MDQASFAADQYLSIPSSCIALYHRPVIAYSGNEGDWARKVDRTLPLESTFVTEIVGGCEPEPTMKLFPCPSGAMHQGLKSRLERVACCEWTVVIENANSAAVHSEDLAAIMQVWVQPPGPRR
jgi:hypothetical protein